MDIGLDDNFDIILDQRNDVPLVEGRTAFEQRLAIRMQAYFIQIIGSTNRSNALSLIRKQAQRVAQDADEIERPVEIEASFSEEFPNTVNVTALYDTGDEFTFGLSE